MAIPGLKASYEVRAKVRIGEKRTSSGGKEYPASVDHFLCDDPEFQRLYPPDSHHKIIRIVFPFADPEDNFSTGLEWWIKKKASERPTLGCYTKDSGERPVALRMDKLLLDDDEIRGEPIKSGRVPVTCRFRECPIFKRGDCKPMGRLQFFLEGGTRASVLQLDTKSWNTIEALTPIVAAYGKQGATFDLSVEMVQRGRDKFPVLSLAPVIPAETEVPVRVNNDVDIDRADAMVQLAGAVDRGDAREIRTALFDALNTCKPGWRDDARYVERIKEIGPLEAARKLIDAIDKRKV